MEDYRRRPKRQLHRELAEIPLPAIEIQKQALDRAKIGHPWVELDAVINNVAAGLMMFNPDMTVNWVNGPISEMFGLLPEDMVGKVWYDLVPPMEARRPIYEKVMQGESLDFPSAEVLFPEGKRYFDVHYRPIWSGDGTVQGLLTVANEITESRLARAALGASEARNRAFLEAIPDMMFHIDSEGIILDFKAKEGETYVPPSEFLGKRLYGVLPPNVAQESERLVQETLKTQQMHLHEYQLPLDGKPHYYEARIVPIGENEVLAVVRDFTASKQAEETLIRLERLKALKELSKGISHNLNNILGTILDPASILRDRVQSPDLLGYANMISESALRAADVVKRLHWAVQDGYGEEMSQVQVNEVVQEVVRQVRSHWEDEQEARGISIEVVTDLGDTLPIWGTRSGFQSLLVGLSLNAIDAMPEGGTIIIRTRQVESGVRVTFSDTGVGMDDEVRTRIFEPFFTTKQDVGSGLGLSSCYRTITGWGGTINVESEPGKGTTFVLWFPGESEI